MYQKVINKVADSLVEAASTFLQDKKDAYKEAIKTEINPQAKWTMEKILENAEVAERNKSPLCDDTGIPHVVIDIGEKCTITGEFIESIKEGIRQGLRRLPGRPMAVIGNDYERINQSLGMYEDPATLDCAPFLIRHTQDDKIKIHILMFGGGSAIRAKTYRVFHKHNTEVVLNKIIEWAKESAKQLGCTPCTLAVGIGRSHYEATSYMLQALVDGSYYEQSDMEKQITSAVNDANIGPLGLGGNHTVLATFMKVGPQRASGVRVVCVRPCCCFEPRIATLEL